jgi:hypothetical protein
MLLHMEMHVKTVNLMYEQQRMLVLQKLLHVSDQSLFNQFSNALTPVYLWMTAINHAPKWVDDVLFSATVQLIVAIPIFAVQRGNAPVRYQGTKLLLQP